jgi:hypothetical protein
MEVSFHLPLASFSLDSRDGTGMMTCRSYYMIRPDSEVVLLLSMSTGKNGNGMSE